MVTSSAMSRTVHVLAWRHSAVSRKLVAPSAVNQCGASREGRFVVAACDNGAVVVWRCDERCEEVAQMRHGGRTRATGAAISGNGTLVATAYSGGGRGGDVALYRVARDKAVKMRSLPHNAICGRVALTEDGDVLAWASVRGAHVHAVGSRRTAHWALRSALPPALAMSRDGQLLAAVGVEQGRITIRTWHGDGAGAFRRASALAARRGGPAYAAAGGRGCWLLGTLRGATRMHLGGARRPSPAAQHEVVDTAMHCTAYVTLVAAACRDGTVRVWQYGEDGSSEEDASDSVTETDSSLSDCSECEFERLRGRWR